MEHRYLTNTSIQDALDAYLPAFSTAISTLSEAIPTRLALGKITAQALYSRANVPHYLACAMDGIAVDARLTFAATDQHPVRLDHSQYVAVDTGDPLPEGTDAVIMIEDVVRESVGAGEAILLYAPVTPWQHVRQIGEDFCTGDMLVPSQTELSAAALGALTAGGIMSIPVMRAPRITLIPTGDEIVAPSTTLKPGEIPEFNSTLFGAMLEGWGAQVTTTAIIPDRLALLEQAVRSAVATSDLVLVLAGSSAGRDDYTTQVISTIGEVLIHGLAIRPGKPAILGRCGAVPVIGLPGYPISGLVVIEEIVAPLLRRLFHLAIPTRPTIQATLSRRLVSSLKYQEYIRVRLTRLPDGYAAIPLDRGAGLVTSFLKADGLLVVPQNCEGYEAGETITVRLIRPIEVIDQTLSVIGSHDPLLDECADLFAIRYGRSIQLASSHAGSFGGILAIRRQEAHLAGVHILDETSGQYNGPAIRQAFPAGEVILVEGVYRQQGLMVAPGNPQQIHDLNDIATNRLRYVNRQKGAGTRMLLDYLLKQLALKPE
ncbi:MAG: molybdopterin biosynthesis protein, partial [Eubacteriales bacterium]|nr:molybdopterin biosynthesis protein [Eubacteriales bacterium]